MFLSRRKRRINEAVSRLAEIVLQEGLSDAFLLKARELAGDVRVADLSWLRKLLHNPPTTSDVYDFKTHGLGGWLRSCQFAVFELIFHLREEALPFVREIAWGEYDWTQGNAIELLLRLAAEGVQTREIVEEIRVRFPEIRHEAQLYAIRPLLSGLATRPNLASLLDELREIEDFREIYDELREADSSDNH